MSAAAGELFECVVTIFFFGGGGGGGGGLPLKGLTIWSSVSMQKDEIMSHVFFFACLDFIMSWHIFQRSLINFWNYYLSQDFT